MQRTQREPDHDNFLINPEQEWQCRWWSKELGVPPDVLKAAIRVVGPMARNVRNHLDKAVSKPPLAGS